MSAQPCGCDVEANHVCGVHTREPERKMWYDVNGPTNCGWVETTPKPRSNKLTVADVLAFRRERFEASTALIEKKGADYNRQQQHDGDTLFNLRVAEILGIVPTAERGILVRLSDKFMRLISLMTPGAEAAVKGESLRDTVDDIHNYLDYALLIWEQRQS